ncbi:MAG: potassium-transporting ATPase subunit KdpC [Burkholderiales bacterium]
MLRELRPALLVFLVMTALTGIVYPLVVTAWAQLFPRQAGGDSVLIGQAFSDPKYFWSRPSATSPQPYNGASSSGSNLGPTNKALAEAVAARVKALRDADPGNTQPVPADLVTASASGLDPDISPQGAQYQVGRVARARHMSEDALRRLVAAHTEGRTLGLLGERRVNVLQLNLALDAIK